MPYVVGLDEARRQYPEFEFVSALTPSEQKAAFHVRRNGEDLCLKLIAPNYELGRFGREITAMQTVSHPNVVRLIEHSWITRDGVGQHHILEGFVAGADMTDGLEEAPWDPRRAASFFKQLASGLAALGRKGIVHRDLKPSNIRVRTDGSPVIIDFGLARHLELPDLTKTSQGAAIGTPLYFAPEQWCGTKRDIDVRTDLFAVGVLMFQALIGRHPFWREQMEGAELAEATCSEDRSGVNEAVTEFSKPWPLLVRRLLSPDRASRLHDASMLVKLLEQAEAG